MMRKSFFLFATAAALASCTQSEVLEVAENRTISFDPFVGKSTRVAAEIVDPSAESGNKLTKFYVFGRYGQTSNTYNSEVFSNLELNVEKPVTGYYWINDKYYKFAAYSDGNGALSSGASAALGEDGNMTISDYQVTDKDLILATSNEISSGTVNSTTPGAIQLNFKHLLSQVSFEFENAFTIQGYTLDITNLSFYVKNQGDYANTGWTIDDVSTDNKTQASVATSVAINNSGFSESWFVIPQSNTGYTASFTATIKDNNQVVVKTNTFSNIPLKTGTTIKPESDNDKWKSGYRYKYTAEINPTNMGLNEIKFTVSVDEWEDADPEIDVTPKNP